MQIASIDDVLIATIMVGVFLSLANLAVSVLNGRTSQMAHVKATSNLRELYERTYRKTPLISRRLISIARPGKTDRRHPPSG
jgi:hypothetical protein